MISLPLMGIGNEVAGKLSCVILCNSLPLMGIGNLSTLHLDATDPHLITPHGDRKRVPGRSSR